MFTRPLLKPCRPYLKTKYKVTVFLTLLKRYEVPKRTKTLFSYIKHNNDTCTGQIINSLRTKIHVSWIFV